MAEKFFLFLTGYIRVRLSGYATGRFMNLCMKHDIKIWDVINHGNYLTLSMKSKSFKKVKPIVKKTKTKVVILKKSGLPFFLFKHRKRKLFFVGILVFLILLYTLSLFLWEIEINGNQVYSQNEMYEFLDSIHINYGMRKSKIDCSSIEKSLRSKYERITWASARMDGTKLTIDVKEGINERNNTHNTEKAGSLFSLSDGKVIDMITRSGIPRVAKNDTVSKGQILISGEVPIRNDSGEIDKYQYVSADGDVFIETVYPYEYKLPLQHQNMVRTGKQKRRFRFQVQNHKMDFRYKKPPFQDYEETDELYQLRVTKHFCLPLFLNIQTFYETISEVAVYDEKEAKQIVENNVYKFMVDLEEKGVQIIEKNVKIEMSEKYCFAHGDLILVTKHSRWNSFKEKME